MSTNNSFFINYQIPYNVDFELTHKCNLNCIHCYLQDSLTDEGKSCVYSDCKDCNYNKYCDTRGERADELETKEVFDILDQLAELGTINLVLTGGEIFLRSDIFEIIEYASKLKFYITLFTNATLLNSKNIYTLSKINNKYNRIKSVRISLYGHNSQIHDEITQNNGSFKKTMDSIKLLKKNKLRISLTIKITKTNFKYLMKIKKLAYNNIKTYNNLFLNVSAFIDPTISGNNNPLKFRITNEQLEKYIKNKIEYEPPEEYIRLPAPDPQMCLAGQSKICITPIGTVVPCLKLRLKAGNIRELSLREIWEKSNLLQFLREIKNNEFRKCNACINIKYCIWHRCIGRVFLTEKNIFYADKEVCRWTKTYKQIKDKDSFT